MVHPSRSVVFHREIDRPHSHPRILKIGLGIRMGDSGIAPCEAACAANDREQCDWRGRCSAATKSLTSNCPKFPFFFT